MQIRKVNHSFVKHKENSILSFETVTTGGKRNHFVTKVASRGFWVFYEVKISVTESSSFFKP
jgi:hypothetical protein